MKLAALAGFSAAIVWMSGCSTMKVDSDYLPATDFGAFKTFAMVPPDPEPPKGLPGYSDVEATRIQNAIRDEMKAKGYAEADTDKADMLIGFSVDGQHRTDVFSFGSGYRYGSGNVRTMHYVMGSLVIDIGDPASRQIVWHGWASEAFFATESNPGLAVQAVQNILAKFPPQSK
jgi:hypothetical protein